MSSTPAITRQSNSFPARAGLLVFFLVRCFLQAGGTKASPLRSTAQAVRVLRRNGHPAFQSPRRSANAMVQRLMGSVLRFAAAGTAHAPMTSRLRRSPSPALVMRPSRVLPPELYWPGAQPSQVATCRPRQHAQGCTAGSPTPRGVASSMAQGAPRDMRVRARAQGSPVGGGVQRHVSCFSQGVLGKASTCRPITLRPSPIRCSSAPARGVKPCCSTGCVRTSPVAAGPCMAPYCRGAHHKASRWRGSPRRSGCS